MPKGTRITPEQRKAILDLGRSTKLYGAEIAEIVGVSQQTVTNLLVECGIRVARPRRYRAPPPPQKSGQAAKLPTGGLFWAPTRERLMAGR